MNNLNDNLRRTLNVEVIRRLLIRYFLDKGYQSLDEYIYPPIIKNLTEEIPALSSHVEVVPYVIKLDPFQDVAEIGWNLFVLGNQRQYLGETHHIDLSQLAFQITQNSLENNGIATRQTTPRRIIHFITKILSTHHGGYVNLDARRNDKSLMMTGMLAGMNSASFTQQNTFQN